MHHTWGCALNFTWACCCLQRHEKAVGQAAERHKAQETGNRLRRAAQACWPCDRCCQNLSQSGLRHRIARCHKQLMQGFQTALTLNPSWISDRAACMKLLRCFLAHVSSLLSILGCRRLTCSQAVCHQGLSRLCLCAAARVWASPALQSS